MIVDYFIVMGLVFDRHTASVYDSWCRWGEGRLLEKSVEQLISVLLDPQPRDRVLDIGCGSGNHLLMLSRRGLYVSGVDPSSYMIQKARERLGKRATLRRGVAEDLPFDDNEFDYAVFINTLEFLNDPSRALREAGRVASKKVFICVVNSLSLENLSLRIRGYFGNPLFKRARFYNLWELKLLLNSAFGKVPLEWRCTKKIPFFIKTPGNPRVDFRNSRHSPFGPFLGVCATMACRVRTDNLPLRLALRGVSPQRIKPQAIPRKESGG